MTRSAASLGLTGESRKTAWLDDVALEPRDRPFQGRARSALRADHETLLLCTPAERRACQQRAKAARAVLIATRGPTARNGLGYVLLACTYRAEPAVRRLVLNSSAVAKSSAGVTLSAAASL